jgi:hypothetical protein
VPPITFVPTQLMHFSCYEKTAEGTAQFQHGAHGALR